MEIARDIAGLRDARRPVVLAAGVFDGVHRGHVSVLDTALRDAAARNGDAWVLTFDPHPLRILHPPAAPAMLTSTPHKLMLLGRTGMAGCVVQPFTRELADLEPEAFIDRLCADVPTLAALVVGYNWTFGRRARGNVELLRQLAAPRGFAVHIVEGLQWNGEAISSTRIRNAVAAGRLDEAEAMLGRPFGIFGRVVHGKKFGRQLGFPTANVRPENEVRPPPGSYAVTAVTGGEAMPAAAYVGHRDRGFGPEIEVHVLDRSMDFYDRDMDVLFHRQLRPDAHFETFDALKAAIAGDVAAARAFFAR